MDPKGNVPAGKEVKQFFTIPKAQMDDIQKKRARAFALESTDKPDISALPPGMAPGTTPTRVRVVSPDGKAFTVPQEQLQQAIDQGYSKVE
jgi:hypothetical protein